MNILRLRAFGTRFFGREQGREMRERVAALLAPLPTGGVLQIGLDGVELLDYTFAHSCIASLLGRVALGECGERFVVLQIGDDETSGYLRENIEIALRAHQVCALRVSRLGERDFDVMGDLPSHLEETLRCVTNHDVPMTTLDVADSLDLGDVTVGNRLRRLREMNLLRSSHWMPVKGQGVSYSNILL